MNRQKKFQFPVRKLLFDGLNNIFRPSGSVRVNADCRKVAHKILFVLPTMTNIVAVENQIMYIYCI